MEARFHSSGRVLGKPVRDPNTLDLFGNVSGVQELPAAGCLKPMKVQRPPAPAAQSKLECSSTKKAMAVKVAAEPSSRVDAHVAPEQEALKKLARVDAARIAGLASGRARRKGDEARVFARWQSCGGDRRAARILMLEIGMTKSTLYRKLNSARNAQA